ncbi:TPA: hypothetical protein ACQJO6_003015 [Vibrio parahaemolyticus]
MSYPEDSLQGLVESSSWWVASSNNEVSRGTLIWAFVPHVDQTPYGFTPVGREIPTEHSKALVKVEPITVGTSLKQVTLPVAAMPLFKNEVWGAYRAKVRPCLVLSVEPEKVDKELTRGKANHSTAPTYIVAPFYGVDGNAKRSGYTEAFTERVRHCEYPQFHWDKLPVKGASESILRLDQMMPIGTHQKAFRHTGYELSSSALAVIDDLIMWNLKGGVRKDSILVQYREIIEECFQA